MRAVRLPALGLIAATLAAQTSAERPRVIGAAHMAYYVTDLNQARAYYKDFLCFAEAFTIRNVAFIKINDRQFIQLWQEAPKNHGLLHDVAFEVEGARDLHDRLAARGVKISTGLHRDLAGDAVFEVTDPFGFTIQLVEYAPDSRTAHTRGQFMPASRPSTRIDHLGILIQDRGAAAKFYAGNFGFQGDGNKQLVGGGPDRFEMGFERRPPTPDRFHIKNHICLSAPDVPRLAAAVRAKPAAGRYKRIETHQLENGKNVAELYDPDGNRIEIMEPPK